MKIHPMAAGLPMMTGQAFDELVENIRSQGQIVPIVIQDGMLLDGRNRQMACDKLGIPVKQVQFESLGLQLTPEQYIWSVNIPRRHLTDDQKSTFAQQWRPALIEAGLKAMAEGGREGGKTAGRGRPNRGMAKTPYPSKPKPTTRQKLAEQAGVSEHKIKQAEAVAKGAPELLGRVTDGELSLVEAVKQAKAKSAPAKPKVSKPKLEFDPQIAAAKIFAIVCDRMNKLEFHQRRPTIEELIKILQQLVVNL